MLWLVIFMKNHILWPPDRAKKKKKQPHVVIWKQWNSSKFSRHMISKGKADEYFMFFKWQGRHKGHRGHRGHRGHKGTKWTMSSPGHEIQSFFTSYLVPHFSEVWNRGIVWQSKDIDALFPQSWTPCHALLCSTLLRGVEVGNSVTK